MFPDLPPDQDRLIESSLAAPCRRKRDRNQHVNRKGALL
jgi:hypothetical protein